MIEQLSSSATVITGSSTHNECRERLWRSVSSTFREIFQQLLECMEELDPLISSACTGSTSQELISACNNLLRTGTTTHCEAITSRPQTNSLYREFSCSRTYLQQLMYRITPTAGDRVTANSEHAIHYRRLCSLQSIQLHPLMIMAYLCIVK